MNAEEFASGFAADESDDESRATARSESLLVAVDVGAPVGFAHLCAGPVEMDGRNVTCGIIRALIFSPGARDAGRDLLATAERRLRQAGHVHIDAFPLYHGYPFHNHKVGILSERLVHVGRLLEHAGYQPHDTHRVLERRIEALPEPTSNDDLEITIDRVAGAGSRPDIWVKAWHGERRVGSCRSVSGRTYADRDDLDNVGYTRWLGVDEPFRRRGLGTHLLTTALREMRRDGYRLARLNCRDANVPALDLYASLGYETIDRVSAYVRDLND